MFKKILLSLLVFITSITFISTVFATTYVYNVPNYTGYLGSSYYSNSYVYDSYPTYIYPTTYYPQIYLNTPTYVAYNTYGYSLPITSTYTTLYPLAGTPRTYYYSNTYYYS